MEFRLPNRPKDSNKGTFGKVLNIAGSWNYRGAAYLSSVSALRVGAGLVTLSAENAVVDAVAAQTSDVVFVSRMNTINILKEYSVISIGCGLGISDATKEFFLKFLEEVIDFQSPIIMDASALRLLANVNNIKLPKNLILTPHPGEAAELLKVSIKEIVNNSEKYTKLLSQKYSATVLIKGVNTKVSSIDGHFYVNHTGSSALAKAGSGDVLTGMIAGFIAQGLSMFEATCLAVNLHGKAGELAAKDLTEYGVLASDLLKYIPIAIKTISSY